MKCTYEMHTYPSICKWKESGSYISPTKRLLSTMSSHWWCFLHVCIVFYINVPKSPLVSTCLQRAVNSCAVSSRLQSHLNNTHRLATPSPLQPTNQERVRVSRAHKALTGRQVKKASSGEFELCEKTDFLSRFRESAVENRQRTELIETWDFM